MSETSKAIIAKLTNVQPIQDADRIVMAEVLGESVIVGIANKEGDVGIYFPAGLCLTKEFALANKLYRKHPDTNEPMGGYLENNARIRFVKMRGVESRGLWMPLRTSLEPIIPLGNTTNNIDLRVGLELDNYLGVKLCYKYVREEKPQPVAKNKAPRERSQRVENFYEIGDTSRLAYNMHRLKSNKDIVVTEKLHGTSGRTGKLKTRHKPNWVDKLASKFGFEREPKYIPVCGTRRTILYEDAMGREWWREKIHKEISYKLSKGMIVYYEIVGFKPDGEPIMPPHHVDNKDHFYTYGTLRYSERPYEIYVYKIVEHTTNGNPIIYNWDQMVAWCNKNEVKHVPLVSRFTMQDNLNENDVEAIRKKLYKMAEGDSLLDNHIREGIVVFVEDERFKHKGFEFCRREDINPYSDPEDVV